MYSAFDIAEYVIKKCNDQGKGISNLKLQKILYFIQAEFLVRNGKPIFRDPIEAWDFGPVVPSVYRRYRIYGGASIPYYDGEIDFPFKSKDRAIMDEIINSCVDLSASQLVEMTHKQDPWRDAYKDYRGKIISNESIKAYFDKVMNG